MNHSARTRHTPSGRGLTRSFLAAGAIAMIATSCASDDPESIADAESTEPAATEPADTATTTPAPDENEADTSAAIDFESCGGPFDCAVFEVPLDYDEPDGETVEIHVTRRSAGGDPVGNLFLNPGGPGFGAEDMVRGLGEFGPPPIIDNFDLIGVDARGTGRSGAIDCNNDDEADAERGLSYQPEDVDAYIADFTDLAAECESKYDTDYLASLTTENAARDMESVRVALGDEPLDFYGASFGTAVGSVYATLFPDSIRSMVLDAATPTDPEDGTFESRATGFEDSLVKLDTSCELWLDCSLNDVGLISAINEVAQTLEAEGTIGDLDAETFNAAVGLMYAIPVAMPDVADGLADALDGDGSFLAEIGADQLTLLPDSEATVGPSGSYQATICADGWSMETTTADELAGQAERTAAQAPNAGPGWEIPCDLWPVTGSGIPAVNYTGSAPILVIGNVGDPITPFAFSEDLATDLGTNATLLTFGGGGHTAAFRAPGCIDDHVFGFLIELVVPEDDARCEEFGLVGLGYPQSPVVDRVTTGSPAEAAGVLIGDKIVEADGEPVLTDRDVPSGVLGEPLNLVIERDGETIELSIIRGPAFHEFWRLADDDAAAE